MASISPFRALRYDPETAPAQQVVTQPYDKISPAMQEKYYQASPYNLVRIILGKRFPGDDAKENVYTRAAASFQNWRADGRFAAGYRAFDLPLFTDVYASLASEERAERRGFIALGQIEEYSANVVFRHEQTLSKPKADRLDLLRANRAHFGQIFMLYSGEGKVDALLDSAAPRQISRSPTSTMWCIACGRFPTPQSSPRCRNTCAISKLIIADGHHRYETALTYRNERRATAETSSGLPAPYDSVMMTFVDMDRPGLVILPTHRLVFGLSHFSAAQFQG